MNIASANPEQACVALLEAKALTDVEIAKLTRTVEGVKGEMGHFKMKAALADEIYNALMTGGANRVFFQDWVARYETPSRKRARERRTG